MSKAATKVEEAVIREAWDTLVKKMGAAKATHFLVALSVVKETLSKKSSVSGAESLSMRFIAR